MQEVVSTLHTCGVAQKSGQWEMRLHQVGWAHDQKCHTRQLKGGKHLLQEQEALKRNLLQQKCETIRFAF